MSTEAARITTREEEPINVSGDRQLKAPAKVWIAMAFLLAGGVAAWTRAELNAISEARRVDRLEAEQKEFRGLVREVRDASLKLGANAEAMQRQLDRMDRMGR